MLTVHALPQPLLADLAEGDGGPAAIEALHAAQVSKHLQLIGALLGQWPGHQAEREAVTDALERARAQASDRFREVVGAPLVGAWASIANRAIRHGCAATADFTQLGALAVVACAAAGVDVEAVVPIRDGVVGLPGLGALCVGSDAASATAAVHAGRITVVVGGRRYPFPIEGQGQDGWQLIHRLAANADRREIRLGLDDVDPYRHGHHAPPADRLAEVDVGRWQRRFTQAWRLLAQCAPARADELIAGLRTLVPLLQTEQGARSATLRHAFGVFGLTLPPTAEDFAVTMVHEFQHSKLSALLDLAPLSDADDKGRYFAPWRTDSRPLSGLLQGVYAFVGVADTWRTLRAADGIGQQAERQFAEVRLQVDRGLSSVESSGALTAVGTTVVSHLRRATDRLLAEPVPADVARAAERALDRIRQQWLARNN
jgi:HEXXH motif-containing protein